MTRKGRESAMAFSPSKTRFSMTENKWRLAIAALSAAVVLFTVWCLVQGITIIFMHLYYFPIVLLAYRYRWKGFYYASLLALTYLILVSVFYPAPVEIAAAVFRVLVFCGIAAVIAALSEQLRTSRGSELQSRALNEQYLALAPAIVLVLDREGVITYLNENGCRILACEAGSAVGKSWVDTFIPPNEQEPVRAVFAGIMNDGSSQYGMVEGTVVSGRGDLRYIRWYNTLLRDADGAVNAILSFGEDITAEKRT
ncbi:MAG: PAS domain-containing protein, partial [Methanomicrobiales archaeon]|nr:PAS domain-containing protein [Methanomicrobiales archaeon]